MKNNNKSKMSLNENNKVPKLRFPEFKNDWEIYLLKNLYKQNPEYGVSLPALRLGEYKYVRQTDIKRKTFTTFVNSGLLLNRNDVLISRTGANAGETYIHDSEEKCVFAGFLVRYNFDNSKLENNYFYHWTKTNKYKNQVKKFITGSGQPQFNPPVVSKLKIFIPNIYEQQKISSFFDFLNKKINITTDKIKVLKQYKKGLTHKLLKKSIIAWINKDFSNTIKLKDILFEHKEYSVKEENYVHVTLSKEGILLKSQRYNRDFLVKDNFKKYKITKKWNICYNPANLKFGVITLNKYGDGIFSPIYITFSISELVNKQYLISLLQNQNFINYSMKFEEGTVYERRAVTVNDFLNIHLVLDKKELQFKYGKILEKIDKLILIYNTLIQLLMKSKNYLTKNMFI